MRWPVASRRPRQVASRQTRRPRSARALHLGKAAATLLWLAVLLVHIITRNLITYLWGRSVKTVLPTSCFFGPPFFVFPLCTYREKQRKRQCFFSRLVGSSEKNKEKGNVFFLASSARHDVEDGFILTHAQAAAMRQPPAESHPVSPVQTQWQSSLSRLCTELRETAARRSATLRCSVCRCGCSPRARPWPHCVDP